jgi:sRNA-binding carbon storage regulator CsrA
VIGRPNGLECLLKVTVLGIQGTTVRLGFEARDDLPVRPWELWERIRAGTTAQADYISHEEIDE